MSGPQQCTTMSEARPKTCFRLLDLPDLVLREVLHHLTGQHLKELRLACKVLNIYVVPRLFDTVVLTPHEPHFQHLLNVFCLHDGGRLAGYVRTLRFDCRYPADLSKPCFWNKSHLHRFHYDAYVLKRNIRVAKDHLIYLLCEFCKILDGLRFPQLRNVIVCGDGVGNNSATTQEPSSPTERLCNTNDHTEPSYYVYRFRCLTGRPIDTGSRWIFDSDPERSQFYVTCLLLAVWVTGRRVGSINFENSILRTMMTCAAMTENYPPKFSDATGGRCVARDFVSVLRKLGFLATAEDEGDEHSDALQSARVGTMLAEVLVT